MAGLDALLVGDVEGEGAHAHLGHLGQDGRVTGRGNDMYAFMRRLLVLCLIRTKSAGRDVSNPHNG